MDSLARLLLSSWLVLISGCGFLTQGGADTSSGSSTLPQCSIETLSWIPTPITIEEARVSTHFNDVFFLNQDVGWIAGSEATLLVTEDGGESWSSLSIDEASADNGSDEFRRVSFANRQLGWVMTNSNDGTLFQTTDGGNSWTSFNFGQRLFDMRFTTTLNLLAQQSLYILIGSEFGESRFPPLLANESPVMVSIPTSASYFVFTNLANTLFTQDPGSAWIRFFSSQFATANGGEFISATEGLIFGNRGLLGRSVDQGASYTRIDTGFDDDFVALHLFATGEMILLARTLNVVISTDRLQTFTQQVVREESILTEDEEEEQSDGAFRQLFCLQQDRCWIVGELGQLFSSSCPELPSQATPIPADDQGSQIN